MLDVALLGTGGMMPLPGRYLSSMVCRLNGKLLLIDCGEGTQVTHKLLGWGYKNIDVICFTHFHADHISGLPGLLLTIGNSGREEAINLVGPPGLRHVVEGLLVIAPELPFDINCIELKYERGFETNTTVCGFDLGAYPLNHRIPCLGYSITVKRQGKFDADRARQQKIPIKLWSRLQSGEAIMFDGETYTPDMVLGPQRSPIKIVYCTDTRPVRGLSGFIKDADLFICEGLYGDDEKLQKAKEHFHMIYREAAAEALNGNVRELWLTHFSPAMTDPEAFIHSARAVFPNTKAGSDRLSTTLRFSDE